MSESFCPKCREDHDNCACEMTETWKGPHDAAAERAAIVAWLRAVEAAQNERGGKMIAQATHILARSIEQGDHSK